VKIFRQWAEGEESVKNYPFFSSLLVGFRGTDDISIVVSKDLDWILTKGPKTLFN